MEGRSSSFACFKSVWCSLLVLSSIVTAHLRFWVYVGALVWEGKRGCCTTTFKQSACDLVQDFQVASCLTFLPNARRSSTLHKRNYSGLQFPPSFHFKHSNAMQSTGN